MVNGGRCSFLKIVLGSVGGVGCEADKEGEVRGICDTHALVHKALPAKDVRGLRRIGRNPVAAEAVPDDKVVTLSGRSQRGDGLPHDLL